MKTRRTLTPERVSRALEANGGKIYPAARALRCSYTGLVRWLERHPDPARRVRKRLPRGPVNLKDHVLYAVRTAPGHTTRKYAEELGTVDPTWYRRVYSLLVALAAEGKVTASKEKRGVPVRWTAAPAEAPKPLVFTDVFTLDEARALAKLAEGLDWKAVDPESFYHSSGICDPHNGVCEGHPIGRNTAVEGPAGAETDDRIYLDERNGEAHAQLIAAAPALARAYYKLLACYIPPRGR